MQIKEFLRGVFANKTPNEYFHPIVSEYPYSDYLITIDGCPENPVVDKMDGQVHTETVVPLSQPTTSDNTNVNQTIAPPLDASTASTAVPIYHPKKQLSYATEITNFPPSTHLRSYLSYFSFYFWDFVTLLVLFAVVMIFNNVESHAFNRVFRLDDPSISYPRIEELGLEESVSLNVVTVIILMGLAFCILYWLVFVRSATDLIALLFGYAYTFLITNVIIGMLWTIYGGFRPNHIFECRPDMAKVAQLMEQRKNPYNGYVFFTSKEICTNPAFSTDGFLTTPGFPSGHAASSLACFMFVSFYLMAKSKGWNFRQGQLYKFCLFVILPICLVLYIGFSRAFDYKHSEYQVLVGWLIGGFVAPWVYKYHYGEIFGFNAHIPNRLLWSRPSFFRALKRKFKRNKVMKTQPTVVDTAATSKPNSLEPAFQTASQTVILPDATAEVNPMTTTIAPDQTVTITIPSTDA